MNFLANAEAQYTHRVNGAEDAEKTFRERAWSEFSRLGLPDKHTEEWRYSSLKGITRAPLPFAVDSAPVPAAIERLRERYQMDFDVLVVVDGRLRLEQSALSAEFKECVSAPTFSAQNFGDGFSSLTAAVANPGVRVHVPDGLRLQRPVLVLRASSGGAHWRPVYNEIDIEEGGCLQMAEIFLGDQAASLHTEITRGRVGVGAKLGFLRIQHEGATASHYSDVALRVEEAASLHLDQINGGAAWSRTSLTAELRGREAEACVHGITFGGGEQHGDQRIQVSHFAADTRSQQYFKGVLKDRARGVVNGKIFIAQDAQRVDSRQLNHALLLSSGAEADIKPELEIYADDVKANHGASIGRLDQDKLFYLVSRGISPAEAQRMLARAFVDDVVMKISSSDLRRLADDFLADLLPSFVTEMQA